MKNSLSSKNTSWYLALFFGIASLLILPYIAQAQSEKIIDLKDGSVLKGKVMSLTNGAASRMLSSANTPNSTDNPAAFNSAMPSPPACGAGSVVPMTALRSPASMSAGAHGPVFP